MNFSPARRRLAVALAASALHGCATMGPDGPGGAPALGGFDPVSFFGPQGPVAGDPGLRATFEGRTYRFASAANKAEFERNPVRYEPQYDGYCANDMVYALKHPGDPRVYRVAEGRLFLFADARARGWFEMDLARNIVLADRYWQSEARGVPAPVQNLRRWVWQVPHHKTDAELAAEQARRRASPPGI